MKSMHKAPGIIVVLVISMLNTGKLKAQTETTKPFRIDIMTGLVFTSFGVSASLEAQYRLNQHVMCGLEFQLADRFKSPPPIYIWVDGKNELVDNAGMHEQILASYSLTTDYYFSHRLWRPFFGLGAGITQSGYDDLPWHPMNSRLQFSGFPRLGLDCGHFRILVAAYLLNSESFVEMKLGFFMGGVCYPPFWQRQSYR